MEKEKRIDRRILKSQDAIRNALIDLIEEKGFDAISVSDITARANINRGTFYLHYRDKFDLLEKTEDAILDRFNRILMGSEGISIETYYTEKSPVPVIVSLFAYIKEHARMMHALLGVESKLGLQSRIKRTIEKNLFSLGYFPEKAATELTLPADYLTSYIGAAHMGVVQTWLQNDCRESPEEMADMLARMSFYGPFQVVRNATGKSVAG